MVGLNPEASPHSAARAATPKLAAARKRPPWAWAWAWAPAWAPTSARSWASGRRRWTPDRRFSCANAAPSGGCDGPALDPPGSSGPALHPCPDLAGKHERGGPSDLGTGAAGSPCSPTYRCCTRPQCHSPHMRADPAIGRRSGHEEDVGGRDRTGRCSSRTAAAGRRRRHGASPGRGGSPTGVPPPRSPAREGNTAAPFVLLDGHVMYRRVVETGQVRAALIAGPGFLGGFARSVTRMLTRSTSWWP